MKEKDNLEYRKISILFVFQYLGNIDFSITKTEHWEINKPSRIRKYIADTYLITMPGFLSAS